MTKLALSRRGTVRKRIGAGLWWWAAMVVRLGSGMLYRQGNGTATNCLQRQPAVTKGYAFHHAASPHPMYAA